MMVYGAAMQTVQNWLKTIISLLIDLVRCSSPARGLFLSTTSPNKRSSSYMWHCFVYSILLQVTCSNGTEKVWTSFPQTLTCFSPDLRSWLRILSRQGPSQYTHCPWMQEMARSTTGAMGTSHADMMMSPVRRQHLTSQWRNRWAKKRV